MGMTVFNGHSSRDGSRGPRFEKFCRTPRTARARSCCWACELCFLGPEVGAAAMNELVGVLQPEELKTLESLLAKVLLSAGDPLTTRRFGDR